MKLFPIFLSLLLTGCATYTVEQKDESPGERIVSTKITATAWFSSYQTLEKVKASQTDKSQSVGATGMNQHGATNTVDVLNALARITEAVRPTP